MNQYIDLINTKPEFIFASALKKEESEIKLLKQVLAQKTANFKDVLCEIGSGSGAHLVELAKSNPDKFYIGLELRFKRLFKTAEKAESQNLNNLFLIRFDAKYLELIFDLNSLAGVYVNFPDPWFKKRRWNDKRLLTPEFIIKINTLLKPNGFFSYKTDHAERFHETVKNFEGTIGYKVVKHSLDLLNSEMHYENIPTEFERLFVSKGCNIHYLLVEKTA